MSDALSRAFPCKDPHQSAPFGEMVLNFLKVLI
jgi:hypothetical protein